MPDPVPSRPAEREQLADVIEIAMLETLPAAILRRIAPEFRRSLAAETIADAILAAGYAKPSLPPAGDLGLPDPHHENRNRWYFDGAKFWHRTDGQTKWVEAKHASLTPARVRMLASLVDDAYSTRPPEVRPNAE